MRNPFIIYPKNVSTLRISDHIYKNIRDIVDGIYIETVDDLSFIISVDVVLSECLVFNNGFLVDGYIMKKTLFKYKNKLFEEYLNETV